VCLFRLVFLSGGIVLFGLDILDVGLLIYLVGGLGQDWDGLDVSCLVLIE